jgi:hypothetical protein
MTFEEAHATVTVKMYLLRAADAAYVTASGRAGCIPESIVDARDFAMIAMQEAVADLQKAIDDEFVRRKA